MDVKDIKSYSILSWIKLNKNTKVLCININDSAIKLLKSTNPSNSFDIYNKYNNYHNEKYDYIFAFHIFESDISLLDDLYNLLNKDGILYLASENANAMAYECGETPSFSNIYAKEYICNTLLHKHFFINAAYTVLPNIEETQILINHSYMVNESLSIRYVPTNKENFNRIINEGINYESIKDLNEFHNKANAYLFELAKKDNKNNILQITLSPDRGVDNFCITTIYEDKVEKTYPFKENFNLLENNKYLTEHNISLVDLSYKDGIYTMPYIKDENCLLYFKRLLNEGSKTFIEMCDKYYDIIQKSSKITETNELGNILEKCYFDLVPLNCFMINGQFVFFDQEFCIDNYPADLIMWRTLYMIYNNVREDASPSRHEMYERYGIDKNATIFSKMSNDFLANLRNLNK